MILVQAVSGHVIAPSDKSHFPFFGLTHVNSPFGHTWQNSFVDFGQKFKHIFLHVGKNSKTP